MEQATQISLLKKKYPREIKRIPKRTDATGVNTTTVTVLNTTPGEALKQLFPWYYVESFRGLQIYGQGFGERKSKNVLGCCEHPFFADYPISTISIRQSFVSIDADKNTGLKSLYRTKISGAKRIPSRQTKEHFKRELELILKSADQQKAYFSADSNNRSLELYTHENWVGAIEDLKALEAHLKDFDPENPDYHFWKMD